MGAEELGSEPDELWMGLLQAIRAGDLDEELARDMLKSAEVTLDTQWMRMFGMVLIYGLVDMNDFDAAKALSRRIPEDLRSDAERVIASSRVAYARAGETSRRAAAQQVLMDLGNAPLSELDDPVVALRRVLERSGDLVTDDEAAALRVRFPAAAAARGGRIPSAADLFSALKDIRRAASDGGA